MRTLAKYFGAVLLAAGGLMAATLVLAPMARAMISGAGRSSGDDIVSLTELPQRSIVYAGDGTVLTVLHAEENRAPVTYSEVPKTVIQAVVDTEDDRFWDHHGVNPQATARALLRNVNSGAVVQGGSTITQQLVKNTLLTSERSAGRKFKEAMLAIRLEDHLSKEQILERYLNTVYFGNGAYGLKAAAESYYGVEVKDLTAAQGAFLAGMIRNPQGYDPFRFPDLSRARRNFVLDRMVAHHDLSAAAGAELKATPLPPKKLEAHQPDNIDSYFVEEVKQRLLEDPRLGDTAQARYNALFRGGLSIYTTLSPPLQAFAKKAVADILPTEGGKWTGALVSVDSKTGAVRAIAGGPGFDQNQYRVATEGQGRQPGSSFKAFVLAAALEAGYTPTAGIDGSSPCAFPNPGGPPYVPSNNEGEQIGYTTITNATALSVNCAFARMGVAVGLDKVVSMAKRMGIETPLRPLISMSLGSEEVRPIDMAGAYATFANDGVHHRPYLVERIVDRKGKVILTGEDKGTQVLSAQKAREAIQVLRSVIQYGTGTAASLGNRPAAGKTGTSERNGNAWFVGFTPQLTTAVWMGSPVGNIPMFSVGGPSANGNYQYYRTVFGGTYPALMWHEFMSNALRDSAIVEFPTPDPNNLGDRFSVSNPPGSYSLSPNSTDTTKPGSPSSSTTSPGQKPVKAPTTTAPAGGLKSPTPTTAPPGGSGKGGGSPPGGSGSGSPSATQPP